MKLYQELEIKVVESLDKADCCGRSRDFRDDDSDLLVLCWHNTSNWRRGVVVITTAQLHSTKPELRLCAGSNPARGVLEIRDGEDLWQWFRLEIRLNAFRRSTIPQKQFIKSEWYWKILAGTWDLKTISLLTQYAN